MWMRAGTPVMRMGAPGSESGFIFEESDVEAPGDQPSSSNPLPQCDVQNGISCLPLIFWLSLFGLFLQRPFLIQSEISQPETKN